MYDPQMCIDSDAQVIYVHGGRVISKVSQQGASVSAASIQHVDFFVYDIVKHEWKSRLLVEAPNFALKPRASHAMFFDVESNKKIIIFGGQRGRETLK